MINAEQRIERLVTNWKGHLDESTSLYNEVASNKKATFAIVFGTTALGLTAMRPIMDIDAVVYSGLALIGANLGFGLYTMEYSRLDEEFYRSAKEMASIQY